MGGNELPSPDSPWVLLPDTDAAIPVRVIRCSIESGQAMATVEYEHLLPPGAGGATFRIELPVWQGLVECGLAKPH